MAGVSAPTGSYGGKDVHPINGKSALNLLRGSMTGTVRLTD